MSEISIHNYRLTPPPTTGNGKIEIPNRINCEPNIPIGRIGKGESKQIQGKLSEDEIKHILAQIEREEQYGSNIEELSDIAFKLLQETFKKETATLSMPEKGVSVANFGDWTVTTIDTYGGIKYSELSEEDKKIVDEYESAMKNWEALSDKEKENHLKPILPEKLEKETETRVKNSKGNLAKEEIKLLPDKGFPSVKNTPGTELVPLIELPGGTFPYEGNLEDLIVKYTDEEN